MYPTISDMFRDWFGFGLPFPIQTFGFFLAISILAGSYFYYLEIKRKEKELKFFPVTRKVKVGAPATVTELVLNTVLGFVLGYKLIYVVLNYHQFTDDPQDIILSAKGNLSAGIIAGIALFYWKYYEKKKQQLPEPKIEEVKVWPHQMVGDMTIIAAISGIIGSKFFDDLEHWHDLITDPIGTLFSFSGLAFYGGLIFGTISVVYYARKNKLSIVNLADAIAPTLILSYGLGRIGCQMAGDGDWGIVNTSPKPHWLGFLPNWMWSFNYPHNVINEGVPIPGCVGKYCFELQNPVFPTPFYETVICVILFLLLWSVRKKIKIPGILFSIYLIVNAIERFFIEQIRINIHYKMLGLQLTQAQIIAIPIFIIGLAGLFYFRSKKLTKNADSLIS
jgi:phosphatidylglycerol---prolipoprotein diacylglyceryl transferase